MYEHLTIFVAFLFVFSLVAGRIAKMALSGPIIYVAFGLVLGPLGFGWLKLDVGGEGMQTLAELTLALVLFTDAANANLSVLRQHYKLPVRLLLIGLPLTILAGFGVGIALFPSLSLLEVAILATMLAPTDAALGKAVVANEAVPSDIREALNVESGLNDGICVPILLVFLALATRGTAESSTFGFAMALVGEEIGIGAGVGLGLTLLGGWLIKLGSARGWVTEVWRQVPILALSVACFALAQTLGGSGFIAAFGGGLLFGALYKENKGPFLEAAEGAGEVMALLTWVVFGSALVGKVILHLSLPALAYAIVSLTLVRMLPVSLSLLGLSVDSMSRLFLGWFGPRGLASIVFGFIVHDAKLGGGATISVVVVYTIILSVLSHGISANPLARAYGRRMGQS